MILFCWVFPDHISGRMSIFPNLSIQRPYRATMIQKLRNLMYRNSLFSSPPQADYITCKIDGLVKSPVSPPLSKIPHSSGGGRGLRGRGCKYLKCCLIHPHLHPVKSPKGGPALRSGNLTGQALSHPRHKGGGIFDEGEAVFRLFTKPSKLKRNQGFRG
jgi:hypothetical protein